MIQCPFWVRWSNKEINDQNFFFLLWHLPQLYCLQRHLFERQKVENCEKNHNKHWNTCNNTTTNTNAINIVVKGLDVADYNWLNLYLAILV